MKEEWSITREEAREASALIWEYLSQGGTNRSEEPRLNSSHIPLSRMPSSA